MTKRIFALVVVLTALLGAKHADAQGLKFGVKGGLNITEMSFDEKVIDSSNKTGFFIGPTAQLTLPLGGLGVDIAALYDQKESEVNDETIKQQSILIPLNLRLKFGLGSKVGAYVAAGPQFGFNIGDDEFKWKKNNVENTFQLKKSSFSVNLGAGVYLTKYLEVGFAYNIPMGTTGDMTFSQAVDGIKDDDGKAKSWTISAAVFF